MYLNISAKYMLSVKEPILLQRAANNCNFFSHIYGPRLWKIASIIGKYNKENYN